LSILFGSRNGFNPDFLKQNAPTIYADIYLNIGFSWGAAKFECDLLVCITNGQNI